MVLFGRCVFIREQSWRKTHEATKGYGMNQRVLGQIKPVIQIVAEELYKKEELTGDEFAALFDSWMQSHSERLI